MGFELAAKANHAYSMSAACFGLAHGWICQGRFADAIRVLEQGLEQTKLHSVEATVDPVLTRLIYAYSRAGQIEQAHKLGDRHEILSFALLFELLFHIAGDRAWIRQDRRFSAQGAGSARDGGAAR